MNTRQTHTWCAGLPRTEIRPFTADEPAAVRRLAGKAVWQLVLGAALTPAMVLALVGAIALEGATSRLTALTGILTALSPAAALVIMRDAWRRRDGLLKDLKTGEIWIFARPEGQTGGPFRRLEILPASQATWLVDGERPRKWTAAETSEVANTPEYAATAAQWVEPADPGDEASPRFNHREMSGAEREEISRHLHRLRWSSVPVAALMTLYAALRIIGAAVTQTVPAPTFLIWLMATVFVDWNLYKRWLVGSRLTRDLGAGRIVIARMPMKDEGQGELSAPVEVLPQSRLVWTDSGQPAAWRVAHASQTTPRR